MINGLLFPVPSGPLRRTDRYPFAFTVMLKNYLKIALRNLWRHKGFSFINIFGLAIGLACTFLILLWVRDELSYDRFHQRADDLYRVVENQYYAGGEIFPVAVTPAPLGLALKEGFPEIMNSTRFNFTWSTLLKYGERTFDESRGACADPAFFQLFTFPLVKGDAGTALSEPHSIVLTETLARKYFGNENPIGKTLRLDNQYDFMVTGLLKDIPDNSHLRFDFLIPFVFLKERGRNLEEWDSNAFYTYLQLRPGASHQAVSKKLAGLIKKHVKASSTQLYLQPLTRIHLHSNFTADIGGHGDVQYVYIFSVVALFILFIACINFMNLSTARSARRSKEVGLRKVVGAYRQQLVGQFLGESVLISLVALVLAIILVVLFLPAFNELSGKKLSLDSLGGSSSFVLAGIALAAGLLAGSYPALYLSSFQPVKVLKGAFQPGSAAGLFRKVLVVGQFSLSIMLIISTLLVYSQLHFIRNKKLGFDKENLIYIPMQGTIDNNYLTIKNELLQNANVSSVTAVSSLPTSLGSSSSGFDWEGKDPKGEDILIHILVADFDLVRTFGMQMAQGRSFSKELATDSANYILNEEAVKRMNLKSPVGKRFASGDHKGIIIGVVKNFHFKPIHTSIEPLVCWVNPEWFNYVCVRSKPGSAGKTVAVLESMWKKFNPEYPFTYHFLDQDFEDLYRTEQRTGKLFNIFSCLAIFISCLGLFGLAAFTAEQRTKEIGIRKVLGASVTSIVTLLSREFVKLVLIANLIAWPLAWWAMNRWLQDFAYRIEMSAGVFISAGIAALLIALFTISFQSVRAARANPVKSLRTE